MKRRSCLWLLATLAWVGLAAAEQTARAQFPNSPTEIRGAPGAPLLLSPTVGEVVRLAENGTTDELIVAYIQNSSYPFNLNADQILYLRDLGLSQAVITAMLNRDRILHEQGLAPAAAPEPMPPLAEVPVPVYADNPPTVVNYFYAGLAPYGAWIQCEHLGWCWQPRAVLLHHGWRPYCDGGHWLYTDAGWCWQSDYSWGWAPFHYGRWALHEGCGWIWVPDKVWAPAWVTWRLGPNGQTCGWAPLPPSAEFDHGWRFNNVPVAASFGFGLRPEHFTFIAMKDFNDHHLRQHSLDQAEVQRIYGQTTIVNNFASGPNSLVNHGLPVARVAEATHSALGKTPIPVTTTGPGHGPARAVPRPGQEAVYRAPLAAPASSAPMLAQRIDARHPVIWYPVSGARGNGPARSANNPRATAWAPARNAQGYAPSAASQTAGSPAAPARYARPAPTAPVSPPAPTARPGGFQNDRAP